MRKITKEADLAPFDAYQLDEPLEIKSKNLLTKFLGFTNVKAYDDFIQSHLWKPYFDDLDNNVITPQQKEAKDKQSHRSRNSSIDALIRIIDGNEGAGRTKYSSYKPQFENFDSSDWYCYVLVLIQRSNSTEFRGLFYNRRHMTDEQKYYLIWTIMIKELYELAPVRREMKENKGKSQNKKRAKVASSVGDSESGTMTPKKKAKKKAAKASDEPSSPKVSFASIIGRKSAAPVTTSAARTSTVQSSAAQSSSKQTSLFTAAEAKSQQAPASEHVQPRCPAQSIPRQSSPDWPSTPQEDSDGEVAEPSSRSHEFQAALHDGTEPVQPSALARSESPEPESNYDENEEFVRQFAPSENPDDESREIVLRHLPDLDQVEFLRKRMEQTVAFKLTGPDRLMFERRHSKFNLEDDYWKYDLLVRLRKGFKTERLLRKQTQILTGKNFEAEDQAFRRACEKAQDLDMMPFSYATENDMQAFLANELLLDNPRFQPQDYEDALRKCMFVDPENPRYDSMAMSTTFHPWQVLAIAGLVRFRECNLRGGLLCDTMGLGKTWECLGYLLRELEYRDQTKENGGNLRQPKPTLIVAPIAVLDQWEEMIPKISDRFIVKKYHGEYPKKDTGIQEKLRFDNPMFTDGDEGNARILVLTTPRTLAVRHGPAPLYDFRVSKLGYSPATAKALEQQLIHEEWIHCLSGCFDNVIIDEAHIIKNMKSDSFVAAKFLGANFYILATGTPDVNSAQDILAYVDLIQPDSSVVQSTKEEFELPKDFTLYDTKSCDVQYDDHPATKILRTTTEFVAKEILPADVALELGTVGTRLEALYAACMIRRTWVSEIQGKKICDNLPSLKHTRVVCGGDKEEIDEYEQLAATHNKRLVHVDREGRFSWNWDHYRMLILLCTWLGFEKIAHKFMAKDTLKLLKEKNLLSHIMALYCNAENKKYEDDISHQLALIYQRSPKIRALMSLIAKVVVQKKKKLLLFCTLPAQQVLMYAILKSLHIDVAVWHSGLVAKERKKLLAQWNDDPVYPMVMLGSYQLTHVGLNMQGQCFLAAFMDPPPSVPIGQQAIARVHRLGQVMDVLAWTFELDSSFNSKQVQNCLRKAAPGALANLNKSVFGISTEIDDNLEEVINVGRWVEYQGKIMPYDDPTLPPNHNLIPIEGANLIESALNLKLGNPFKYDDNEVTEYGEDMLEDELFYIGDELDNHDKQSVGDGNVSTEKPSVKTEPSDDRIATETSTQHKPGPLVEVFSDVTGITSLNPIVIGDDEEDEEWEDYDGSEDDDEA